MIIQNVFLQRRSDQLVVYSWTYYKNDMTPSPSIRIRRENQPNVLVSVSLEVPKG